jgi:hypothetical protein
MTRFLLALCLLPLAAAAQPHTHTNWQIEPSLKYDALCLLNAISGDPYYLTFYQAEYDHFHALFTPAEQAAFTQLKRVLKDDAHGIVSAQLALYYSVVDDTTLADMIRTASDSSAMEAALRKTSYWSDDGWRHYQEAQPALLAALRALQRTGFPDYWAAQARPKIDRKIEALKPALPQFDIVPAIERTLGFELPSNTVTVYLLAYSEPHGIRITGLRFLTHVSYPFDIVLHNSIHESMHPPYPANEPALRSAIEQLASEPLVLDKVRHHDASLGYNTAAGYVEEDSVQALEQIVSEQFRAGRKACQYWKQQDGGMHILAAALYAAYKEALAKQPQPYWQWLVRAVQNGQLRGAKLQASINAFFAAPDCR